VSNSAPTPANQADPILAEHADAIWALGKRAVGDVIEIGRRLSECKRICGHGNWLRWLDREFGWTDKTAEHFINVYKLSGKFENFSNLDLPFSALYMLAAPSTPETARTEIIKRAQSGEVIPLPEVKRTIDAAKGRKRPVKRDYSPAIHRAEKPPPRDDIGPNSASEADRLRVRNEELERENHRLARENLALRSEVDELKAELAKRAPIDDGLDIPACLRRAAP
jgi:DUF3102 family protein